MSLLSNLISSRKILSSAFLSYFSFDFVHFIGYETHVVLKDFVGFFRIGSECFFQLGSDRIGFRSDNFGSDSDLKYLPIIVL